MGVKVILKASYKIPLAILKEVVKGNDEVILDADTKTVSVKADVN